MKTSTERRAKCEALKVERGQVKVARWVYACHKQLFKDLSEVLEEEEVKGLNELRRALQLVKEKNGL